MSNTVSFKSWSLDALAFTAITVPINCNYIALWNTGAVNITLRSTDTDSSTEKTLSPATQEVIGGTALRYRFTQDSVVVYAKAASGTATLHASYVL